MVSHGCRFKFLSTSATFLMLPGLGDQPLAFRSTTNDPFSAAAFAIFPRLDLYADIVARQLRLDMLTHTVNVDCVKFEYVVLAKYHHMLIFEFDLLTKQHIVTVVQSIVA